MAFTEHLKIMVPLEMDTTNLTVQFPSGYSSHTLYAEGGKISIIDDEGSDFELNTGTYITFKNPNLQGQTITVTGAVGATLHMISEKGLAS